MIEKFKLVLENKMKGRFANINRETRSGYITLAEKQIEACYTCKYICLFNVWRCCVCGKYNDICFLCSLRREKERNGKTE